MLAAARDVRLAAVGAGLALLSGYILVHRSASLAIAVAAAPLLVWILLRPSRGLALGLILILSVPYWQDFGGRHAYQVAAGLALVTAFSARRVRPTIVDLGVFGYIAVCVLGWLLQYAQPDTWHFVLDQLLIPLGFYIGARAVPRRALPSFMAITLFAGTIGALTVIYEFAAGHPVFIDPTKYLWNSIAGELFRPGGIYGSPPGAATVLMFVVFFGLAALSSLRGKVKGFAIACMGICTLALILTFTRAPLIGAGAGLLLFLWLIRSPLLRPSRVLIGGITLMVVVVLFLPTLASNSVFQQGVARAGTLTARESYWKLALPIAFANPHNFIVGVGTGMLETPAVSPDAPLPYLVAATPQVFENSLHNQYVTTLVEQGIIGLAALVFLVATIFVPAARAARATQDVHYAAIAAAAVGMAIVMAIDTELLHTPSLVMFLVAAGFAASAARRDGKAPDSGSTAQRARVT